MSAPDGFSADWLALREPFDHAARADAAQAWALDAPDAFRRDAGGVLRVLDLACGSGNNLRALAPRLGGAQVWTVVDHDPALLEAFADASARWAVAQGFVMTRAERLNAAPPATSGARAPAGGRGPDDGMALLRLQGPGFDVVVHRQRRDLAAGLEALPWAGCGLVTASALLDLVSLPWLNVLMTRACEARSALLFALNVDERVAWSPADPDDALVQRLFDAHQRRDKGFGPALGHAAIGAARDGLAARGYRVACAASDWRIDASRSPGGASQDDAMLRAQIEGMAAAALEQDASAPGAAPNAAALTAWRLRRLAGVARTRLRVGHQEVLARP